MKTGNKTNYEFENIIKFFAHINIHTSSQIKGVDR